MRLTICFLLALAGVLWLSQAGTSTTAAQPQTPPSPKDKILGRYIVVFNRDVIPGALARELEVRHGFVTSHLYEHALSGFAAELPESVANLLRAHPFVRSVEPDKLMRAFPQTMPTGITRIQTQQNATAAIDNIDTVLNVDVAVIDSGSGPHPELNIVGGYAKYANCDFWCQVGFTQPVCGLTASYNDANGHGTHVAGTIGARDNNDGVVGVAPGARIWSIRVLGPEGVACESDAITAIDWVTARRAEFNDGPGDGDAGINFAVANMSFGGPNSPALCTAVVNSIGAGISYVAAAGNSAQDAANTSPANCGSVITVSAIADYNGVPGGGAAATCTNYGADDSFASFSNFGSVVDIAAPGVCINSTWLGGGYNSISGTSMASPHVAGAAALLLVQNPSLTPAQVLSSLLASAFPQGSGCGFSGDPDPFPEPVLNVGGACTAPSLTPTPVGPTPTPTLTPTPTAIASPTPTATATPAPAGNINYGETISGTISVAGETDLYTFAGTAGERVLARVTDGQNSAFSPRVIIRRPDGSQLCTATNPTDAEVLCLLDASGTHGVVASDNATATGNYYLHIQRTNNPVSTMPISLGDTLTGIGLADGELRYYIFSGASGERIAARLVDGGPTSGFYPEVRIHRPDGTRLCFASSASDPGVLCLLDATGPHAIVVGDIDGLGGGTYYLHLQKMNPPNATTPISYGNTLNGTGLANGEMRYYSFNGTAGERVLARLVDGDGTSAFFTEVRLHRPDGTQLCSAIGGDDAEALCLLNVTGTHTIAIGDFDGLGGGNYHLHLERMNPPSSSIAISYGQTLPGSGLTSGELRYYSFNGTAGDRVLARLVDGGPTSGGSGFYAEVRIHRPDGTKLCSASSESDAEATCLLNLTGTHTIVIGDLDGIGGSNYYLHVQRLNGAANALPVAYGQTLSGSLSDAALVAYVFTGVAGEQINVRLKDTTNTSAFFTEVRVFRPDGTMLCSGSSQSESKATCTLNVGGAHTILVGDFDGLGGGPYDVRLCLGACP